MHIVCQDQANRARNAKHTAGTCEMFVYSIVKITRLYDFQTRETHFLRSSQGAQRHMSFFLDCALCMLIDWAGTNHTDCRWGEGLLLKFYGPKLFATASYLTPLNVSSEDLL